VDTPCLALRALSARNAAPLIEAGPRRNSCMWFPRFLALREKSLDLWPRRSRLLT
jgi:hypothetical protein